MAGFGFDVGGLIGGLSSLFGTMYSADRNYEATMNTNAQNYRIWQNQRADEQNRYNDAKMENRYLTDLAYNRTIEQRDYENWYNSPEQQVQRYRDAGLNPYLMMSGQNAIGSVSAGSAPVGSPPSGYGAPAAPHMIAPQLPDFGAAFGNTAEKFGNLFLASQDLTYKRISTISNIISALSKDNSLSPETKDKIMSSLIGKALLADDSNQKSQKQAFDAASQQIIDESALTTMRLNIQNEENDAKRKEWSYLSKKYDRELKLLAHQITRIAEQNKWLDDEGRMKKSAAKALEYEVDKIGRENDLFNGELTFRSVLELIQKMFSGNAILGLIGNMLK